MKVLIIINSTSPYRIDFFNELAKYCELTVWFESQTESNRKWNINQTGMNFNYKFLKGVTFGLDQHLNLSVIKELNSEKFDVYLLGGYSLPTEIIVIHWLKMKNIPFILNSDGGFVANELNLKRKFKTYLISSASCWLSSGVNCTNYFLYYGAKKEELYEYPFSSTHYTDKELEPLPKEMISSLKQEHNLNEVVILSIGQFIDRKGFDVLIHAISRLDREKVSLLLIGGGELKKEYENLIEQLGLKNVVIKEFMQKNELVNYFKVADIFVLPTRYDIWGLVINEAITFGLPTISTYSAGAAYDLIEEDVNGFIVEKEDIKSLVEKCNILVNDKDKRNMFSKQSQLISKKYTIQNMVNKHVTVIRDFYEKNLTKMAK